MSVVEVAPAAADQAQELFQKMNQRFAIVHTANGVSILDEGAGVTANGDFRLLSKADFGTAIANVQPPIESRQTAAGWWLAHARRREYTSIVFAPDGASPSEYNIWRGFAVGAKVGDCSRFWTLVREVICAGSEELYSYVRRWLAHLVQKPGELPETALVLLGKQGTGKSFFTESIGRLVGRHYLSVTSMAQVTGRFNGHLAHVLLLNANEATWGGNKAEEGALKSMITDAWTPIEFKGKDVIKLANYKRLVVCSNNQWAVPQDADDRRFLILDVSDAHKEDVVYFGNIATQLNAGGYEALMHDLANEDLSNFDPRRLPRTAGALSIKLKSAEPIVRWLFERLQSGANHDRVDGDYGGTRSQNDEWHLRVPTDDLYASYSAFCRSQQGRAAAPSEFSKTLRQLLPDIKDVRPTLNGKRTRCLTFAPLEACRKSFAKYMKQEDHIAWEVCGVEASNVSNVTALPTKAANSRVSGSPRGRA